MQILAVSGVVGAFAAICVVIYLVGRSLQRRGHNLTFVDPRYPDSLQAVPPKVDITPPRPYPHDDTSLSPTPTARARRRRIQKNNCNHRAKFATIAKC
ncbi:MAG: hypothetical protein QOE48_1027 [Mycobacterium sp.]|nr:hypothetical protein [Mycobacterium sp.]